ncbi:hypothetical protein P3L10_027294 [Capsicum annuum]
MSRNLGIDYGEVLLRCRDLECGSVFKISKESSRLWPQSVSEPLQDGFVYTERKRVMKHSEINKMDVHGTMEILSRLPVRSLVRFKCVSKFWMALISEPYFTLKHLHHAKNDQNSQRFLVNQWSSLYCSSLSSVQRVEEVQKLDCPSNTELWRCFYIVVMIAWRLSGFIIIVIIPINFGYGTHPPENQ